MWHYLGWFFFLAASPSPEEALMQLMEGNARFVKEQSLHPNRIEERRHETAAQQKPLATILGCSDSRVSPEILFDQGIGDLFIVRVAGNVAGVLETESIDYSLLYLDVPLIFVLGHEQCGAVLAIMSGIAQDISALAQLIAPAVTAVPASAPDRLKKVIIQNVRNVVDKLSAHPVIAPMIQNKKVAVVGGYYDFHTGRVDIL